jgi:hypothetical protein
MRCRYSLEEGGGSYVDILLEAKGVNGQLHLLENKIRIRRAGFSAFLSHGFKGDKEILIRSISSIQFKKAGCLTNGYIQFAFSGGKEAKEALFQAASDENTVMFDRKQQPRFERIKHEIETRLCTSEEKVGVRSDLDELRKLADLYKAGIVTVDEFEQKKKQLLGLA